MDLRELKKEVPLGFVVGISVHLLDDGKRGFFS